MVPLKKDFLDTTKASMPLQLERWGEAGGEGEEFGFGHSCESSRGIGLASDWIHCVLLFSKNLKILKNNLYALWKMLKFTKYYKYIILPFLVFEKLWLQG